MQSGNTTVRVGGAIAAILGVVFVLFLGAAACGGAVQGGKAGEVGVVRNGAPWNGSGVRGIMPQGAGAGWVGIGSSIHFYPAAGAQRYYTISANPGEGDKPGVDVVHVPTADGIQVGIEGTIYFKTAFDGTPKGNKLVTDFDKQFGIRTFPVLGKSGDFTHAYSGDTGWSSFLDAVMRPVIDNELRQAIGTVKCAQLVSSCALVTSNGGKTVAAFGGTDTQANIQQVQDQVNTGLEQNLQQTLGEPYLTGISFRLSRVTLPAQVQKAVDTAQASFAQVTQGEAQVKQAEQIAKANEAKQKAYANCPTCGIIDQLKALPAGATVFFGVPGVKPVVSVK